MGFKFSRLKIDGSGWEWMGGDGSKWKWVGVDGRGWEWVEVGWSTV